MRSRERILASLEGVYREAFERAEAAGDESEMARLDFDYRREQIRLEVLLDVRELLSPAPEADEDPLDRTESILEKAERLRRITRLR
jgi:hypothetical protein